MTVQELNALDRASFVAAIGWVFEHSPWVAERAWEQKPFDDVNALHSAMVEQVESARPEEQLSLLRAHPDLGTRAKIGNASTREQAGAGLDRLTEEEFEALQRNNALYQQKFGFPFLFAVKGSTKHDILKALEQRLSSTVQDEYNVALQQVYRIARFRLEEALT